MWGDDPTSYDISVVNISNSYFYNAGVSHVGYGGRCNIINNVFYNDNGADTKGVSVGNNSVVSGNMFSYSAQLTTSTYSCAIDFGNNCIISNN